ncbi:asparaginase (plasmid) [Parasedimentitalea marina]|uniref:Asparaginase n=1 Tax=Parasedimentitalea marina TaxID=2483033 RepID=A0A3T0N9U0_9RHOB|nr:asparaginase domain-containing protein [Parasedimentitalea marina]AZV80732.1 asparaginase [Parasedimentitalea marina]
MTEPHTAPAFYRAGPLSVAVIMTGGTIAKSYDPAKARLYNFELKVKDIIDGLRTDDLRITFIDLMQLDSLDIGDAERVRIAEAVAEASKRHDAVLVTHGTDSMPLSGEVLCATTGAATVPVIFTGAMVPFSVSGTDAIQNVTEALLALRLLPPGAYIAFHNRILSLPGVRKDYDSLTFEEA